MRLVARAAQVWHKAGYRHEYAMALAESADTDVQLAALGVLDAVGAKPLASLVRNLLRRLGVTRSIGDGRYSYPLGGPGPRPGAGPLTAAIVGWLR
jgi:hypothetical protein